MNPIIRIFVPGNPPRKNERHRIVRIGSRATLKNSGCFLDFVDRLRSAYKGGRIDKGLWRLYITTNFPRTRHLADIDTPLGDVDAPISCVMDAMELAGIIDDDARFVQVVATKHREDDPGLLVELERVR